MARLADLSARVLPEEQRNRQRHPGKQDAGTRVGVVVGDADREVGEPVLPREPGGGARALLLALEVRQLGPGGEGRGHQPVEVGRSRRHGQGIGRRDRGAERTADQPVSAARALATSRSFAMRSFSARASSTWARTRSSLGVVPAL